MRHIRVPRLASALAVSALLATMGAPVAPAGPGEVSDPPARIEWRTDFEGALEEAILLRRPLLVSFTTTWCGWCRKLEAQTFRDPEFVRTASEHTVPVAVDGDAERGLATMFRVRSYPTTILLDRRGREIGRIVGFQPPEPFTNGIRNGLGMREDLATAEKKAASAPADPEALYRLGDTYLALGRYAEAKEVLARVQPLDGANATGLADDAQLDLATATFLGGNASASLPMYEAYLERFPESDRRDQGFYFYGLALDHAGRDADAQDAMAAALAETRFGYIRERARAFTEE